jgi:hypothetical protein
MGRPEAFEYSGTHAAENVVPRLQEPVRSGMPSFVTAIVASIILLMAVALQLTFGATSISSPPAA